MYIAIYSLCPLGMFAKKNFFFFYVCSTHVQTMPIFLCYTAVYTRACYL